ncbi:hypothetical protein GEMRC1_007528 [Eukaryota sp. GEM-RC1]
MQIDYFDCDGCHRRVYGILCAHELQQVRKWLSLRFHVQWLLQKRYEDDSEDEEDLIDIWYRNWASYNVYICATDRSKKISLQVMNEPLLPPSDDHANTDVQDPIQTNTTGQSTPIPRKKAVCKNSNELGHY